MRKARLRRARSSPPSSVRCRPMQTRRAMLKRESVKSSHATATETRGSPKPTLKGYEQARSPPAAAVRYKDRREYVAEYVANR